MIYLKPPLAAAEDYGDGMFPRSLYHFIWLITRRRQIAICLLTGMLLPLSTVPLEIQRRIVDEALVVGDLRLLLVLGAGYIGVMVAQNGLKLALNMTKARALEDIARDIRRRMLVRIEARHAPVAAGTVADVLSAEAEEVASFASDSIWVPLLQGGTILFILGYLVWVQPLIAALAFAVFLPQGLVVPYVQHRINRLARLRTRIMRRLASLAIRETYVPHAGPSLNGLTDRLYRLRIAIWWRKTLLTFIGNLFDAAGPISILMLGGWLVLQGQTPVGTLIVFISGFQRIAEPWDQLITFYRSVSNARIAYGLVGAAIDGERPPALLTASDS